MSTTNAPGWESQTTRRAQAMKGSYEGDFDALLARAQELDKARQDFYYRMASNMNEAFGKIEDRGSSREYVRAAMRAAESLPLPPDSAMRLVAKEAQEQFRANEVERLAEGAKIWSGLTQQFTNRYGDPQQAAREYEARPEAFSGFIGDAVRFASDFPAFVDEMRVHLGDGPVDREKMTEIAARSPLAESMRTMSRDALAAAEADRLGQDDMARAMAAAEPSLRANPELAAAIEKDENLRDRYRRYVLARSAYLNLTGFFEEHAAYLAKQHGISEDQAYKGLQQSAAQVYPAIAELREGLPEGAGPRLPPPPRVQGQPGAVAGVARAAELITGLPAGTGETVGRAAAEFFGGSIEGALNRSMEVDGPDAALLMRSVLNTQLPRGKMPKRLAWLVPANVETAISDLTKLGLSVPFFAVAEAAGAGAVGARIGTAIGSKLPVGPGGLRMATAGGRAAGSIMGGEAISPEPRTPGERALRVGIGGALGAAGGAAAKGLTARAARRAGEAGAFRPSLPVVQDRQPQLTAGTRRSGPVIDLPASEATQRGQVAAQLREAAGRARDTKVRPGILERYVPEKPTPATRLLARLKAAADHAEGKISTAEREAIVRAVTPSEARPAPTTLRPGVKAPPTEREVRKAAVRQGIEDRRRAALRGEPMPPPQPPGRVTPRKKPPPPEPSGPPARAPGPTPPRSGGTWATEGMDEKTVLRELNEEISEWGGKKITRKQIQESGMTLDEAMRVARELEGSDDAILVQGYIDAARGARDMPQDMARSMNRKAGKVLGRTVEGTRRVSRETRPEPQDALERAGRAEEGAEFREKMAQSSMSTSEFQEQYGAVAGGVTKKRATELTEKIGRRARVVAAKKPSDLAVQGGFIPPPVEPRSIPTKGQPPTVRDVAMDYQGAIERAVKTVRQPKGQYGVHRIRTGGTQAAGAGDLRVLFHEGAHDLDFTYGILQDKAAIPALRQVAGAGRFWSTTPGDAPVEVAVRELFGEWNTAFMLNPAEAKRLAPLMDDLFRRKVPAEVLSKLEEASRRFAQMEGREGLYAMAPAIERAEKVGARGLVEKAKGAAGLTPDPQGFSLPTRWYDSLESLLLTKGGGFKRAGRLIEEQTGKELRGARHPYTRAKGHLGLRGTMEHMFKQSGLYRKVGQFVTDEKTGGRMTEKFFREPQLKLVETGGKTPDEWHSILSGYMEARHVADLKKLGRFRDTVLTSAGAGVRDESAWINKQLAAVSSLPKEQRALVHEAQRRMTAGYRVGLDVLRRAGFVSRSVQKRLEQEMPNYVPLKRVYEAHPGAAAELDPIGQLLYAPESILLRTKPPTTISDVGGKVFGKLKTGRKAAARQILDPQDAFWERMTHVYDAVGRNQVFGTMVEPLLIANRTSGRRVLDRIMQEVPRGTQGAIPYYRPGGNGQPTYYLPDPAIRRSMENFWRLTLKLPRILTFHNDITRAALTRAQPVFTHIINPIRDFPERLILSASEGIIPSNPLTYGKRIPQNVKDDLVTAGASQFGWFMRGPANWAAKSRGVVEKGLPKNVHMLNPWQRTGYMMRELFDGLDSPENAPRLAEGYRLFLEKMKGGADRETALYESMIEARMPDFAEAGYLSEVLNQLTLFWNPAVKSSEMLIKRLATGTPRQKAVVWTRLMSVTAMSLAAEKSWNYMIGGDEAVQLQKDLPAFRRVMYANYYMGNGRWLRMPMSYSMAWARAAATLGERSVPASMRVAAQSVVPEQEMKPFDQIRANYDEFLKRPIVYDLEKHPDLRAGGRYASGAAKLWNATVGKPAAFAMTPLTGITIDDPRQWDFLADSMFGYYPHQLEAIGDQFDGKGNDNPLDMMGGILRLYGPTSAKNQPVIEAEELVRKIHGRGTPAEMRSIRSEVGRIYEMDLGRKRDAAIARVNRRAAAYRDKLKRELKQRVEQARREKRRR